MNPSRTNRTMMTLLSFFSPDKKSVENVLPTFMVASNGGCTRPFCCAGEL
jgi:hypothetical protein